LLGGPDAAKDFYAAVLETVRPQIDFVYLFYTIIPPRKVPRVYLYGEEQTATQDPVEFLDAHKAGYVVLCAWKYSEVVPPKERAELVYLDYFQTERTRAWDALSLLKPLLFIRGDTCNPCVAMADELLSLVDRQLKRNLYIDNERLDDRSIVHALRDLRLKGTPIFIGQPDLKKIVPYTRDKVVSSDFVARPVHFLSLERRPKEMDNKAYREMVNLMPIMDHLVESACEIEGSIKLYDATEDYLLARPGDLFAFYGNDGREMCNMLGQHVAIKPLDLTPRS